MIEPYIYQAIHIKVPYRIDLHQCDVKLHFVCGYTHGLVHEKADDLIEFIDYSRRDPVKDLRVIMITMARGAVEAGRKEHAVSLIRGIGTHAG